MSRELLSQEDVMDGIMENLKSMDGEGLADLWNNLCPSKPIVYLEDSLWEVVDDGEDTD
jgi:hypothetical protein